MQNAVILPRAYIHRLLGQLNTLLCFCVMSSLSSPLGRARWDVGSKIYWNKVRWIPASSKPTTLEQLAQAKLTKQFE